MADNQISSLDMSDEEWLASRSKILSDIPTEPESKPEDTSANKDEQNGGNNQDVTDPNADPKGNEDEPNEEPEGGQGAADDQADKVTNDGEDVDPNKEVTDENVDPNADPDNKENKPRGKDGKFTKAEEDPNKGNEDGKGDNKEKPANNTEIDFKAQHDLLLTPIKANGRDFQVKNVDEARHLISMGLNYNKKMAALKPNLAIMKQLQNSDLLDPDKINFLIDLSQGNPQAIAKLVADHKVDPLSINSDDAVTYKPSDHRVNEVEVDLDNVIDELKDHPKFNQVMQLVSKEWDKGSQQTIAQDPKMLRNLAAQMESGIYDRISMELERRQLFGSVSGKSDLEAYREIGNELAQSGAFDDILGKLPNGSQQAPAANAGKVVDPRKPSDASREQQRRAAAPNKPAKPAVKGIPDDFDPLNMSDEDFKKLKIKF